MCDVRMKINREKSRLGTWRVAVVCWVVFGLTSSLYAGERYALVIGNSGYTHSARLGNPTNDARAVAAKMEELGFSVSHGFDLTKPAMDELFQAFSSLLEEDDVAVFFYAGHGMQIDKKNFLVPIDFNPQTVGPLINQLMVLDELLNAMASRAGVNLVFLDACRNNPLANQLVASMTKGRSAIIDQNRDVKVVGQGLAQIKGKVGTLIAYATQPGNVALDGAGSHSPFTTGLLEHIAEPGVEVRKMLTRVRVSVLSETDGQQIPWDHSSLVDSFYFKKKKRRAPPPP